MILKLMTPWHRSTATQESTEGEKSGVGQEPEQMLNLLPGRSASLVTGIRSALFNKGYNTAVESGSVSVDNSVLEAGKEQARASADAEIPTRFDPANNVADKQLQQKYDRSVAGIPPAEVVITWAKKRYFEIKRDIATTLPPGAMPPYPVVVMFWAVLLFATALTATIEAILPEEMKDGSLLTDWGIPSVIAVTCGLGLSVPQLRAARAPNASWFTRHLTLIAGLVNVAGLSMFRFRSATSPEDTALGYVFVGIDLAAVCISEAIFRSYRLEYLEWKERGVAYEKGQQQIGAAEDELRNAEISLEKLLAMEAEIHNEISACERIALARDSLIADCVNTYADGYRTGIAHNFAVAHRAKDNNE